MNQQPKNAPRDKYLEFINIATQMGIIIAAGVFAGVWLDSKYPNEYSVFTIGISLLGVFIALFMVINRVIQMSKDQ